MTKLDFHVEEITHVVLLDGLTREEIEGRGVIDMENLPSIYFLHAKSI